MNEHYLCSQQPTPYYDLNRVLREFVTWVQSVLEDNFVGAYLQGSFAIGDFDLHSDVDFIIVIAYELSQTQLDALQEMHYRIYEMDSRWARHLEGSYFPREIIASLDRRGEKVWYLNNGVRDLIRSVHCNTGLVRHIIREQSILLAGAPPETLAEPVSKDILRREIYERMISWKREILNDPDSFQNRFYQAYIVLNYCRMLNDLRRGFPGSKLAGAEWVIYNGIARDWDGLIERSWARRSNPANWVGLPADPDDYEAALVFAQHIINLAHEFMESGSFTARHP